MAVTAQSSVTDAIKRWKESLTDFSGRNLLLYFKPTKSSTLQLANEPGILFDRLVSGKTVPVCELQAISPQAGGTDVVVEAFGVEAICIKLRRSAKMFLEETGISPLTLAFDFCEWDSPNGQSASSNGAARHCRAPAILMPVTLHRPSTRGAAVLAYEGGEIVINPVMCRALQRDYGVQVPELPSDAEFSLLRMQQSLDGLRGDDRIRFTPGLVLGLFSFNRLVMVEDLERNESAILAHPVLGALLGTNNLPDTGAIIDPQDLDEYVSKHRVLSVVDADSSQQAAIEAAKAGRSFVIQGPPGTGKSQTITNIIAELIADGKRVLFVSAKRAALEVVLRRMSDVGLGDLCLDAHDDGADKKRVIADLFQTCENALAYKAAGGADRTRDEKLRRCRQTLNAHVSRLHSYHHDMEMSLFRAYGLLCADNDHPVVPLVVRDPALFAVPTLDRLVEDVARVALHADLVAGKISSLWHSTALGGTLDYTQRMDIKDWLNTLDAGIGRLEETAREIANLVGVPLSDLQTSTVRWMLNVAQALIVCPDIEPAWLAPTQGDLLQEAFQTLRERVTAYRHDRDVTLAIYSEGIFGLPLEELHARIEGPFASFFKRLVSKEYRRDRKTLQELRYDGAPSYAQMRAEVSTALAAHTHETALGTETEAPRLFGSHYRGAETDVEALGTALNWASRFVGLVAGRADPVSIFERVGQASSMIGRLRRLHEQGVETMRQVEEAQRQVRGLFPVSTFRSWEGDVLLHAVRQTACQLRSEMHLLDDWLTYRAARQNLERAGFPGLIDQLLSAGIPAKQWRETFRRGFVNAWVEYQHTRMPELGGFRAAEHERIIEEFKALDKQVLDRAKYAIRASHAQAVQSFVANDRAQQYQRLASEAKKKRQVWPVRKLLAHIPELLLHVKPCWMMSPLSVTQMVDARRVHFDTVIFDEASQLRTEEAVSAILRGKQVIVVGDEKQLPPTSFFALSLQEDSDDQEETDAFESILDQCAVHLPRYMLRWHYRSRDESLIAFSNQTYYHNQLVTFPSADHREGSGVSFRFVEGAVYDRGGSRTNRKEAQVVAQMICDHYAAAARGSLGVIALSQAQQTAIQDALEVELRNRPGVDVPETGPDALFIKNLENVQGDERDHIVLSIGYGKSDTGVLNMNFGPLNKQGGGRRLNVAITRARQSLTVVSSIRSDDIDLDRTRSDAVRHLRDYLVFAESNGQRLQMITFSDQMVFDSPFEADVWQMLVDRGYRVHPQVGCSQYRIDLAVIDPAKPGRYLLGIECDGATYHSSPTARDRDRLRQSVLEGLGWTIHRIWSRDWIRDKMAEIEKVEQRIRALQAVSTPDARIMQMYPCPQCGQPVRAGAHFCGYCRAAVA
jgi:very-short-patch-repair endonuclease